jgi:hypothetical protein
MTDDDAGRRAATWLAAWDGQGIHRTATAGDEAGASWLLNETAVLGAEGTRETVPLDRLDPVRCHIDAGGVRYDGVPVFDAPATGPEGIAGRLAAHGAGDGTIGVVSLPPSVVYTPAYRSIRADHRHNALVIVCQGVEPGLGLLNAEQFRAPYGCPALHVAGATPDPILEAAAAGREARFVAHGIRTPAAGTNVVVTLRGRGSARPPIVVMTPRSSWWQSTAERGGGLVCWLETLRALLAEPPNRDVVLTANTGHELGHLGLDEFIAARPGWDQPGGATWIHYGANIGATGGELSIMSADEALRSAMQAALTRSGRPPDRMAPVTQVPSGETRDIHRAGGRYLTIVGSNRLFHLPRDRYPEATDVPAITRIAAGAARMVVALSR